MENTVTISTEEYKDLIQASICLDFQYEVNGLHTALQEQKAKYEAEIAEKNQIIVRQFDRCEEKDKKIQELESQIKGLEKHIDVLEDKLAFYQPYSPEAENVKVEDVW